MQQMLSVQNTVITTNFDQKKRTSLRKHLMTINLVYRTKIALSWISWTSFIWIPLKKKWTAPLPFRQNREPLPDKYSQVLFRDKCLDASLSKNNTKKEHFIAFMQKIFDSDHAELAPFIPPEKEHWHLPLFSVYHPCKPDQIRGFFDSSAEFKGMALD